MGTLRLKSTVISLLLSQWTARIGSMYPQAQGQPLQFIQYSPAALYISYETTLFCLSPLSVIFPLHSATCLHVLLLKHPVLASFPDGCSSTMCWTSEISGSYSCLPTPLVSSSVMNSNSLKILWSADLDFEGLHPLRRLQEESKEGPSKHGRWVSFTPLTCSIFNI